MLTDQLPAYRCKLMISVYISLYKLNISIHCILFKKKLWYCCCRLFSWPFFNCCNMFVCLYACLLFISEGRTFWAPTKWPHGPLGSPGEATDTCFNSFLEDQENGGLPTFGERIFHKAGPMAEKALLLDS